MTAAPAASMGIEDGTLEDEQPSMSQPAEEQLPRAVSLFSGSSVPLKDGDGIAEAWCSVAAASGVSPTRVMLVSADGPICCDAQLERAHVKGQLITALVRQRPIHTASVARGAGFWKLKHINRSPSRCQVFRPLRDAVKLPPGVRLEEWIAAHTCAIFDDLAELRFLLKEYCTPETCPHMCARHTLYNWMGPGDAQPRVLCAPDYMDELVVYAQDILFDASLAPHDGQPFAEGYLETLQVLLKRFFCIFAHTFLHHWDELSDHEPLGHDLLRCSFREYLFFVKGFNLVTDGDLAPLQWLIEVEERRAGVPA